LGVATLIAIEVDKCIKYTRSAKPSGINSMKYVSQLYRNVAIKPKTFNAVYSAMGSGKTYLIKVHPWCI